MKNAMTILLLLVLDVLIWWGGSRPDVSTAGVFASLFVMSRLISDPPAQDWARVCLSSRTRQLVTAVASAALGAVVFLLTPVGREASSMPLEIAKYFASMTFGVALALFVHKDPEETYSEWARRQRLRIFKDQA